MFYSLSVKNKSLIYNLHIFSVMERRKCILAVENIDKNDVEGFKKNIAGIRELNKLFQLSSYGEPTTILCRAATTGRTKIIEIILQTPDIVIDKADGKNETPLQLAMHFRHFRSAELLIEQGANPVFKDGRSALHLAAENGNTGIILAVMAKNISPDVRDKNGNTAIHIAVKHCEIHVVQMLLGYGADILIKNNAQERPIDLLYHCKSAKREKISAIRNLLDIHHRVGSISSSSKGRKTRHREKVTFTKEGELEHLHGKMEYIEEKTTAYRNEAGNLLLETETKKKEIQKLNKQRREILKKLKGKQEEKWKLQKKIDKLEGNDKSNYCFFANSLKTRVKFYFCRV